MNHNNCRDKTFAPPVYANVSLQEPGAAPGPRCVASAHQKIRFSKVFTETVQLPKNNFKCYIRLTRITISKIFAEFFVKIKRNLSKRSE